jgi:hypothetical protein
MKDVPVFEHNIVKKGGMEVKHHIFWKWMEVASCLKKEPQEPLNRF